MITQLAAHKSQFLRFTSLVFLVHIWRASSSCVFYSDFFFFFSFAFTGPDFPRVLVSVHSCPADWQLALPYLLFHTGNYVLLIITLNMSEMLLSICTCMKTWLLSLSRLRILAVIALWCNWNFRFLINLSTNFIITAFLVIRVCILFFLLIFYPCVSRTLELMLICSCRISFKADFVFHPRKFISP